MATIHELLDDTQKQCQSLVEEMEAFKSAKTLNQRATDCLESACEALKKTAKAIEPFTELRVRRLTLIVLAATALNSIMFLAVFLIVLLWK